MVEDTLVEGTMKTPDRLKHVLIVTDDSLEGLEERLDNILSKRYYGKSHKYLYKLHGPIVFEPGTDVPMQVLKLHRFRLFS